MISIHAPAKGATSSFTAHSLAGKLFQSTLPRRERQREKCCIGVFQHFNPRSREGSDTIGLPSHRAIIKFQSTLPRRERRSSGADREKLQRISIHAPAKGATSRLGG